MEARSGVWAGGRQKELRGRVGDNDVGETGIAFRMHTLYISFFGRDLEVAVSTSLVELSRAGKKLRET